MRYLNWLFYGAACFCPGGLRSGDIAEDVALDGAMLCVELFIFIFDSDVALCISWLVITNVE